MVVLLTNGKRIWKNYTFSEKRGVRFGHVGLEMLV